SRRSAACCSPWPALTRRSCPALSRSRRGYAPSTFGNWLRASLPCSRPASAASRVCWSAVPFATSRPKSCAPSIPSFAPFATSIRRRTTRTGSGRNRFRAEGIQLAGELGWVRGRRLADEALAKIGGHLSVDRGTVTEQRHGSRLTPRRGDRDQTIGQVARSNHL